ncbi:MAG: hypothetical protein AAFZ15_05015 [Bacteroidota bacterium]
MKVLFFLSISILFCPHFLYQNSYGLGGKINLSKCGFETFDKDKIVFHSTTCISQAVNSVIKENKRTKKKAKSRLKKKLEKLVKHKQSDTGKKPESFWTTVVLGLGFAILMAVLNAPIAMLFFLVISGIGLGGYYIFRKRNKKVAEAFLTVATALNLGLGVVALFGIWLGGVVD